ncbi:taperin [Crotalus tigris]|uniref:taperin n=1 Tax=Crotalus tigris TaxID=88082 RepID=UPI00192FA72C|nr:taperin [Crotalus tigris]
MSSLREGAAAAEAPAWKLALLERKRAKLASGMGLERGRGPAPRLDQGPDGREAGTVVAESLGPLRENPFMRLESERRRRRRRGACDLPGTAAAPSPAAESPALAQLLQLYGAVPGIRTIRADNILIIESSDPADPAEDGGGGAGDTPGRQSSLRDLLACGGPPVTEIRAAQVVVYEPEAPPIAAGPDSGLVSRLLQKFDRAAKGKRRGGEDPAPAVPPPPRSPAACPDFLPGAQGGGGGGFFLQKIGSNSFVVNPRGHRPGLAAVSASGNGRARVEEDAPPPPPPSGPDQRGAAAVSKAVPSSQSPEASFPLEAEAGKPKPEAAAALEALPPPPTSAIPDSRASADPARPSPLFSSSCSFEIRPAPKPDLAAIPAHDLQAHALASLRLSSRNSFLFVPHRKAEPPGSPMPWAAPSSWPREAFSSEPLVPVTDIDEDLVAALPPLKVLSPRLEGFHVPREGALAREMLEPALPASGPFSTGYVTRSSTFTIVPKRKPPTTGLEPFSRAWLQEEEEEDRSQREAQMGALQQEESGHIKKRYPTVNEIKVIGGYLSLDKSCMSKAGIRRKKMKISFNEASLQTTFEYPSESSLVEEEEEEEEYATEIDEKPAFLIPHPNTTINSNPVNSGLSGYTPKHSLGFNQWQEQQHKKPPSSIRVFLQDTDQPDQRVMLTPAEKSHLSDFSSEPALYF